MVQIIAETHAHTSPTSCYCIIEAAVNHITHKKKPTVVTMLRTAICLGEQNGRILPTIPPPAL